MNEEQFKIFPFEKDKFYVILFNPMLININSVEAICANRELDVKGIFIPCEDVELGMQTVSFESKEEIRKWLEAT